MFNYSNILLELCKISEMYKAKCHCNFCLELILSASRSKPLGGEYSYKF